MFCRPTALSDGLQANCHPAQPVRRYDSRAERIWPNGTAVNGVNGRDIAQQHLPRPCRLATFNAYLLSFAADLEPNGGIAAQGWDQDRACDAVI